MDIIGILCIIAFIALIIAACVLRNKGVVFIGGEDLVKNLAKYPRSKSEAAVVRYFEELTGESFPSVNPDWLVWKNKTLELDGYCKYLKLAVEFSGPLHTKWYPGRETYKKYFTRVLHDVVKRKICKRQGVNLVVVDMTLPPRHWRAYIASRLSDVGALPIPTPYIDAQKAAPYRNEHLEAELGLTAEMEAARNI